MTAVGPDESARSLRVALAAIAGEEGGLTPLALGWATVDLERAAAAFIELFGPADDAPEAMADDELLGATCLRLATGRADLPTIILLEPNTEGRLAASLARNGEGPTAAWILGDDRALARSRPAAGPFGSEVLLLDGLPTGPHRLLVLPEAGTITP